MRLGSRVRSGGRSFRATLRPRRSSVASHTSPMPPDPTRATTLYGPSRVPACKGMCWRIIRAGSSRALLSMYDPRRRTSQQARGSRVFIEGRVFMNGFACGLAVILIALTSSVQVAGPALPELVGSWKIVSYEDRDATGVVVYPYG